MSRFERRFDGNAASNRSSVTLSGSTRSKRLGGFDPRGWFLWRAWGKTKIGDAISYYLAAEYAESAPLVWPLRIFDTFLAVTERYQADVDSSLYIDWPTAEPCLPTE